MSIERLEQSFSKHLEDDRAHHEKLAASLTSIEVTLREISKDVDLLNEKVILGNGNDSMLTRLKNIENYIKNQQAYKFWAWPTVFAGMSALTAIGALVVSLVFYFYPRT